MQELQGAAPCCPMVAGGIDPCGRCHGALKTEFTTGSQNYTWMGPDSTMASGSRTARVPMFNSLPSTPLETSLNIEA